MAGPEDGGDGKPVFHMLPRISDTAVADLLQVIRTRVMRFLVRGRVVEADTDADTMLLPDDLAERDPALAQLAAAAPLALDALCRAILANLTLSLTHGGPGSFY